MSQNPRFVALDSLRGVAALGVAAFHVQGGGLLFDNAFVDQAWLLVDFFFVLSGFVIAANYAARLSDGFPARRFLWLRLGRLYPLHLAVLALYVMLELGQWLFAPDGWSLREPFTGAHSLGQLVLTVLLLHGFALDTGRGWSAQSWSISIEVWLYAAMAVVWKLAGRAGWIVALGLACVTLATFAGGYEGLQEPLTYNAMRGLVGFPLGVAAWELWARREGLRGGTLVELAAVAACIAVVVVPLEVNWRFAIADPVFALTVLVFAAEGGALSRLLQMRLFALLGTLSYSIYLIHPMVIGRGVDVLRQIGLGELTANAMGPIRRISAPPGWDSLLGLGLLAATIAVAWLTWRFIEQPLREWSRRVAPRI